MPIGPKMSARQWEALQAAARLHPTNGNGRLVVLVTAFFEMRHLTVMNAEEQRAFTEAVVSR